MYYSFEYVQMKSVSMMRCYKILTLTHMEIKKLNHYTRYRVNRVFEMYFINEQVIVQAQMLKGLLSLRKLKEAMTLLGIRKSTEDYKNERKCDTKYK